MDGKSFAFGGVMLVVGALGGWIAGNLMSQNDPSATVEDMAPTLADVEAEVRGDDAWVPALLAAWIDEPAFRGQYSATDGTLKSSANDSVFATLNAQDRTMLAKDGGSVTGAWRFDGDVYLTASSRVRTALYALEDGFLRELHAAPCGTGPCLVWHVLGLQGTKLILWQTGADNSPGPCFTAWNEPLVAIDLEAPEAGIAPYAVPAYKRGLAERQTNACVEALTSSDSL